jgi:hypothetical protein
MGRGRAKAKQTKVARELKYSSGGTDLEALRKELTGASPAAADGTSVDGELEDDDLEDADDDELGSYGASGSR